MEAKQFNLEKDLHTIHEWCRAYNIIPYHADTLSSSGYIISDICAGWLYKTNSKVCYMENFIANKNKTKAERNEALDMLFTELINEAKKDGYKFMLTTSKMQNMIKKGTEKFGFVKLDDLSMFVRSL